MMSFEVFVISRIDPLKYLIERPVLLYRTARWSILLNEFDIKYVNQKSIKGSVIADYLASCPVPSSVPFSDLFPNEDVLEIGRKTWRVYFDGAANKKGCGIGVLLVSPEEAFTPLAVKLGFEATNNIAEYEACILALEAALELGIKELEVFGDSTLILCQIKGE